MSKKWNIEDVKRIVSESFSKAECLRKITGKATTGNYQTLDRVILENSIDTSHFTGQLWNKGKNLGFKRPVGDYLNNSFPITPHSLKLRLIKEGVLNRLCSVCGFSEWMGREIPLELDHIDGNRYNNNLENIRIICPNCHAQTDNYKSKNRNRYSNSPSYPKKEIESRSINKRRKKVNKCKECGMDTTNKSYCSQECFRVSERRVGWPDRDTLLDLIKEVSMLKIGKMYGVCDNTVRKWAKYYNIDISSSVLWRSGSKWKTRKLPE